MALENVFETDVLVIGGGQAGFFAAIKARGQGVNVILADKGFAGKSGQSQNPSMIDVYEPESNSLEAWVKGGWVVNEYIVNQEWLEMVFKESRDRWNDLCEWGLESYKYDKDGNVFISPAGLKDGEQIPVGGLGSTGTGRAISPIMPRMFPPRQQFIRKQAIRSKVKIMDRITITDLIKQDGRIVGAVGFSADDNDTYIFKAKAVVLCMGKGGLKYPGIRTVTTTNDGDAMAYRVGCEITGKEWTDNHPARADFPAYPWTTIDRDHMVPKALAMAHPHHNLPMYNAEGTKIESISRKTGGKTTGGVFDGLAYAFEAHAGRAPLFAAVKEAKPNFWPMDHSPKDYPREERDEKAGEQHRVRMAFGRVIGQSHELSDGVWPLDTSCATQIPGLYAAGDNLGARPGYPMAGFAMMFCSVTGTHAGINAAEYAKTTKVELNPDVVAQLKKTLWAPMDRTGGFGPAWVTNVIRGIMTPYWVLYVKHADRLTSALSQIEFLRDNIIPKLTARDTHELRAAHETKSMALHCEMKLRASLFRTESRWNHYREDYPMRDDPNWLAWVKIKDDNGVMTLSKESVPQKYWPDLSLPYDERYPTVFPGETRE